MGVSGVSGVSSSGLLELGCSLPPGTTGVKTLGIKAATSWPGSGPGPKIPSLDWMPLLSNGSVTSIAQPCHSRPGSERAIIKVSAKGVVLFEKFDSKITVDSKSTLAEKGNEYIMNLVGKREKVE